MAGKPRYTPQQVADVLHELKGMQFLAAKRLGCSHDTIANYIKRYAIVRKASERERGEFVDLGELKFREAVMDGQPWAVSLLLCTLGKERGYVKRNELTGADGEPLGITRLPSKAPTREEWHAQNRNGHAVIHKVSDGDPD